ncbi:MAG: c-type cytochrome [Candidatus Dormibacter sp.]|uniref:c-type cytochrome n=1 Tax=Candidatus Dormibacter sp. TaxID=2973982 RepID=UPI003D9BC1E2
MRLLGSRRWSWPAAFAILIPALLLGWTLTAVSAAPTPSPSGAAPSAAASSGAAPAPGAAPAGDVQKGAQLYSAQGCTSCHGANLEGGVGPKLNPIVKLPGVPDPKSPAYIAETIKNGRKGDSGYSAAMPAFGDKLKDQDLADLAAFIIDSNKKGAAGLSPSELAKSNVFWITTVVFLMVLLTWLLSRYNMRWIARRAAERRSGAGH